MAMMRPTLALACTIAVAAILAGCGIGGDSEKIPQAEADRLLETLGELEDAAATDNCTSAEDNVVQLRTQAEQTSIGETLRAELMEGVDRTEELVAAQVCADTGATGAEGATETEEPKPDRETTTTDTTTTTTEEPAPAPEEPEVDDGGGEDAGGEDTGGETDPGGGNPPPGPEGNPSQPPSGGIGTGGTGAGGGGE
jgi:hypothetical protein